MEIDINHRPTTFTRIRVIGLAAAAVIAVAVVVAAARSRNSDSAPADHNPTAVTAVTTPATTQASATTVATTRSLQYVSLGDGVAFNTPDFNDALAGLVQTKLGIPLSKTVYFDDFINTVAEKVGAQPSVQDSIKRAAVVSVTFGANEIASELTRVGASCGGTDGLDCMRTEESKVESSYRILLDKLTALRPATDATYILMTQYDVTTAFPAAQAAAMSAMLKKLNSFICDEASVRQMKCADVHAAMNGPDGSTDLAGAGFIRSSSDGNTTVKGAEVIAQTVLPFITG
jgi:hypothetical protein